MSLTTTIGGLPVLELAASGGGASPRLTRALVAPGRAMMLLQLWADLPGRGEVPLIETPDLDEAAARLNDPSGAFPGNVAYAFGGAVLAPFANRVCGRLEDGCLEVETGNGPARLAPNGDAGTVPFAIHGLILNTPSTEVRSQPGAVEGVVELGDDGAWPSVIRLHIAWRLSATALDLEVTARNIGEDAAPVGLGWHPYFRLPSGDRTAARLCVPAASRAVVNNYQAVLPTGEVEPVAGTAYDFNAPGGRPLGGLFLDDCFLDLARGPSGDAVVALTDPASGLKLHVSSASPQVQAFQIYAPTDKPFVVIEPQFNLADPFGSVWGDRPTGMVHLKPGAEVAYHAQVAVAPAG